MINNKVAQESINTVLRYLYQQKPDFGKVDEEVSPEKLKQTSWINYSKKA